MWTCSNYQLVRVATILSTIFICCSGSKSQYFTFYQGKDCIGSEESFYQNDLNLYNKWVTNAESVKYHGAWRLHFRETDGSPVFSIETGSYLLTTHGDEDTCRNLTLTPAYAIIGLERFGSLKENSSEIILCTERSLKGVHIYANSSGLRLPSPVLIESYLFTGKFNWILYEGTDFNGASVQVNASKWTVDENGIGITMVEFTEIPVGSIKLAEPEIINSQTRIQSIGIIAIIIPVALKFV